jgi:CheY-like chemotaxis protein
MAHILVIDDEPTIRRLIRLTLGPEHHVGEAGDGEEALRTLLAEHWDIAILDASMPVLDGLSVCRAARAEPSLAHLGIIVVSAYVSVEDALDAGADRHLRKPFRPLELLATIEEVVASRRDG